jgi:hypothetical protein
MVERGGRMVPVSSYTPYGIPEPTPIPSPLVRTAATALYFASPSATHIASPILRPTISDPRPVGPDPIAIKEQLQSFCDDGPALDAFYKEMLERPSQQTHTPPTGAVGSNAGGGLQVVPEASIPILGLPPGVLREGPLRGVSPARVGSPAQGMGLFRRGSIQDNIPSAR